MPYLTAIEVERVSVGIGRQLPTATSDGASLDCFPVGFGDSCRFKIIFNVTGKLVTEDRAVVTWGGGGGRVITEIGISRGKHSPPRKKNNVRFQVRARLRRERRRARQARSQKQSFLLYLGRYWLTVRQILLLLSRCLNTCM